MTYPVAVTSRASQIAYTLAALCLLGGLFVQEVVASEAPYLHGRWEVLGFAATAIFGCVGLLIDRAAGSGSRSRSRSSE